MSSLPQLRAFAILAGLALFHSPAVFAAQSSRPDQMSVSNGQFRIAGTVVSATGAHPLARARVVIVNTRNPENVQSLVTSEDGRFEFAVNAGKYSLQAAKRGFIAASYNQHEQFSTAIVTGAGIDTENLILRLAPAAVLAGKVIDESGDFVRNASITVFREDHRSGISRIQQLRNAQTDDKGAYEITPLDGGTYFVSVNAKPWYAVHPVSSQSGTGALSSGVDRSLDVAYPITYYGDATEADDATPIPIRGGDHVEVDIHLSPVPALHLLFRVPGNGTTGFTQPQLQKPAFDGMDFVQPDGVQMVSPGVFEMTGIAAGRYSVRMPGSARGQLTESTEVDLTSNNQELDVSSGSSTSKVKATVKLLGGLPLPSQLGVALRNSKGRIVAGAEVDAKGEIEFQDVSPGTYDVLAGSNSKAYSVVRIASHGSETSGHSLNAPAGSSLTLSLSLVGGVVTIEGFAKRSGRGIPGAMVVLVPKNPELNHELFRRDQSDLDGSFSMQSVIPGAYTIVAIENGWDLDWAKPPVIARYCLRGQSLIVGDQIGGSMQLSRPVEVQPRW
jgi:hypothetical protein